MKSGKNKLKEVPQGAKVILAEKSIGTNRWKKEVLLGRDSTQQDSNPTKTGGVNSTPDREGDTVIDSGDKNG